jgi:4-hydroxy-3-methylbut-2-enyl diphosphate reductase
MEVIISKNCGYCNGVKKAIKILDNTIKENISKKNIYTLGSIIHNQKVVKSYEKKGVFSLEDINELKAGDCVVIRSHGVSPDIIEELNKKTINVLNATCNFVLRVHKLAKDLSSRGYFIILIGEKNHPEVTGIAGNIKNNNFVIINTPEEAQKINPQKKIAVISQTTQTKENFLLISKKIVENIKDEVLIINTICKATEIRQNETAQLAKKTDVMIIAGGKNSANTTHLAEISGNINKNTYHIENAEELKKEWFKNAKIIGITGGASTPLKEITDIKNIIQSLKL